MLEKPYQDGPLPPGVAARVQLARTAHRWLPDVEAYLVERGLSTELAPVVCDLIDAAEQGRFAMIGVTRLSLSETVDMVAAVLHD